MKTASGYIQGYNGQAAVNGGQIVVACGVTQEGNDSRQLLTMISATEAMPEAAGVREKIGLILADAGYWSGANAIAEGHDRLIATTKDWKQRRAARELGTTTMKVRAHPRPRHALSFWVVSVEQDSTILRASGQPSLRVIVHREHGAATGGKGAC